MTFSTSRLNNLLKRDCPKLLVEFSSSAKAFHADLGSDNAFLFMLPSIICVLYLTKNAQIGELSSTNNTLAYAYIRQYTLAVSSYT